MNVFRTPAEERGTAANWHGPCPAVGVRGTAALWLILWGSALLAVWLLARPLAVLFLGGVVACAVAPAVEWLTKRLPRSAAVAVVYVLLVAGFVALGWVMGPRLVAQATEISFGLPTLLARAQRVIDAWGPDVSERVLSQLQTWALDVAQSLLSVPLTVAAGALDVVLVFVLALYWSLATPGLKRFALSLAPPEHRPHASAVLAECGQTMGGFVRAVALDALLVGVVVYVGLRLIGVDYPVLLALAAALGELIPIAGPFIAGAPAVVVAYLESPQQALAVLAFYLVLQQVESHVLVPNLMERQADIPPVLAVFALLAGGSLGGIMGAIVAIPLAGALRVLTLRVLAPVLRARWREAT